MGTKQDTETKIFASTLKHYQELIEADIKEYSRYIQQFTLQQYGSNARLEIDAYLDILSRGGKRIRGSLVMLGYEMSGGQNRDMIIQAARAVEMLHAYILIIDDIQDRSLVRRGGPTAHISLGDYHRQAELAHESEHFGLSIALNAALAGGHAAQMILASLDAPEQLRLNALSIMNRTMLITAHGQTNDIINEVVASVSQQDVDKVLELKTAHYTFLNPLHVGMVLAGADCHATDAITDYAIHAGKAFQITDDILGTFGSEFESGKSPMDDTREGKRTVLTVYALENAEAADKNFLLTTLGNPNLTPAEFQRCKDILVETGALAFAKKEADKHVQAAIESLEKEQSRWNDEGVQFLKGLAEYILTRST